MTNDKTTNGRDRRGETLFIDARQLGTMETRVLRIFTDEDIAKIADTVQAWKTGEEYGDVAGFCKSVSRGDIEKNRFILTPGRYVGTSDINHLARNSIADIQNQINKLNELISKGNALDKKILSNLRGIGFDE